MSVWNQPNLVLFMLNSLQLWVMCLQSPDCFQFQSKQGIQCPFQSVWRAAVIIIQLFPARRISAISSDQRWCEEGFPLTWITRVSSVKVRSQFKCSMTVVLLHSQSNFKALCAVRLLPWSVLANLLVQKVDLLKRGLKKMGSKIQPVEMQF